MRFATRQKTHYKPPKTTIDRLPFAQDFAHARPMANYERRGRAWRVRLYVDGNRESATFPTKVEAVKWATQREAELVDGQLPDNSLKDALRRYATDVSPIHKGEQWELHRLKAMGRDPIAAIKLARLKPSDVAAWRDRRLATVQAGSVRREMNLLRGVLNIARREWGWIRINPLDGISQPPPPRARRRRISPDEIERLSLAFGISDGLRAETATQRIGLAFLLALETAMRAGEILGLTWNDVREKYVILPKTKNGDQREVPLSQRAREILAVLPRDAETVFDLDAQTRDTLWRRVRDLCEIKDLHFHDSRAEAIWRLSKKIDVMELARIIGHRDLKSLLLYYETSAAELADRLG